MSAMFLKSRDVSIIIIKTINVLQKLSRAIKLVVKLKSQSDLVC